MICHVCAFCFQPYGTHTDECPAPRRTPPEPEVLRVQEQLEEDHARILEAWLRGAAMLGAPRGGYVPKDEPELP